MQPDTLFFVGPRASGKTTVAALAAQLLCWRVLDTDAMVRELAGCDIAGIVREHGWDSFREQESIALEQACTGTGQVVATGGGVVLRRRNREMMRQAGVVVYLQTDADTLLARLSKDPNELQRPALSGLSPADEMRAVLAERGPLYSEVSHYALDAAAPPEKLAEQAVALLRQS